MKYLPLIWSGIWRKRGRTILIILQISVAFALFGVLQGMKTGVDEAIAKTRADLLFVAPSAFGGAPLPLAYIDRLRSIPGVGTVAFADGLLGTYQKPTEPVYAPVVLILSSCPSVWPLCRFARFIVLAPVFAVLSTLKMFPLNAPARTFTAPAS